MGRVLSSFAAVPTTPVWLPHREAEGHCLWACAVVVLGSIQRQVKSFLYPCLYQKWQNERETERATCFEKNGSERISLWK